MKASMREKLLKIRERAYLVAAFIFTMTSFFPVAKGEHNIRLVYDHGTKCSLNVAIWVPSFWLPTIYTLLRMIMPNTWTNDNDIEEMFRNFVLHDLLQPFGGVDLTPYFPEEVVDGIVQLIKAWTRAGMGF
jgi:hypothetical protein